jgi:ribosomal protein S18 acetylase RimI-like enzyme
MTDYRAARADDVAAIAALHAESWRRAYRGIYSDDFLDNDVFDDRLAEWSERFARPSLKQRTTVAEVDGELVGFVHTILDDDRRWGALLDNLHVRYGEKRGGIGTRLMAESALAVLDDASGSGLYLWVLERNVAAQSFYDARGGTCVERVDHTSPDGSPAPVLRYVWPDPSTLRVVP